MYLYLGQNIVVPKESVIGVFDLDNASWSHRTRAFLAKAERAGEVTDVSGSLPKAFVITREGSGQRVYLSQLNSSTLLKRWDSPGFPMQ